MKGIILAGGRGTHFCLMTLVVSKQLSPIYDKPLIYYPFSVLLLTGIRGILLISTPEDVHNYQHLLGDDARIGVLIEYKMQEQPRGLAEAPILDEESIAGDRVYLILGDSVFYGQDFTTMLRRARTGLFSTTIFGYPVRNPTNFGVVAFDVNFNVQSIEERPERSKSHFAVPGLYFYDNSVVEIAKSTAPFTRGELEITVINDAYLQRGELQVVLLGRNIAWLNTGTPEGMLQTAEYVEVMQAR